MKALVVYFRPFFLAWFVLLICFVSLAQAEKQSSTFFNTPESKAYFLGIISTRDKNGFLDQEERVYTNIADGIEFNGVTLNGVARRVERKDSRLPSSSVERRDVFRTGSEDVLLKLVRLSFSEYETNATAFLQLSAHGNKNGLCYDSSETNLGKVLQAIQEARNNKGPLRRLVLLIDACHSGYQLDLFRRTISSNQFTKKKYYSFQTGVLVTSTGAAITKGWSRSVPLFVRNVGASATFQDLFALLKQEGERNYWGNENESEPVEWYLPKIKVVPPEAKQAVLQEPLYAKDFVKNGWYPAAGPKSFVTLPDPIETVTLRLERVERTTGTRAYRFTYHGSFESDVTKKTYQVRLSINDVLTAAFDTKLTFEDLMDQWDAITKKNRIIYARILLDKSDKTRAQFVAMKNPPPQWKMVKLEGIGGQPTFLDGTVIKRPKVPSNMLVVAQPTNSVPPKMKRSVQLQRFHKKLDSDVSKYKRLRNESKNDLNNAKDFFNRLKK